MAVPFSRKMTTRLNHNSREGSVSDAGSLGGISTISDSRVMRYNRKKLHKSTKDGSVKPKIARNIFGVRQTFNVTENVRTIRSVSSDIIISPTFVVNEGNRKHNRMTKEKVHVKNLAKRLIAKRKATVNKTDNSICKDRKKTIVPDLNNRSHDFENASNYIRKSQLRLNTLFDFGKNRNADPTFPQAASRQDSFSVTSSETMNFNKVKSRQRKSHCDYLKEFDLIRFRGSKELVELSEDERIFSLVPKISHSEPVTLPMKRYKHCVMSINDSKDVSRETEGSGNKELNETTMKIEFENTLNSLQDNKCLKDTWFANDRQCALVAKKPIRIKCIDEASNGIRDIIIYSDDFLKDIILKRKDKCTSKKEIYESILKESTEYEGKSLRIIVDVEKYFCGSDNNRVYEGDIETQFSEMPNKISKPQTRKMSSRIPRCKKIHGTFSSSDQTKKEASIDKNITLTNENSNEAVDIKSDVVCDTELGDSNLDESKKTKDTEILEKEKKKLHRKFIERKSRTALKRINIESIIESSFRYYFHSYAKLGRPLKSGIAISKANSTNWLKKCGIVHDNASKNEIEKYFIAVACAKYVLNICDYIKFLNKIAKDRRMLLIDIICRMMSVDVHSLKKPSVKLEAIQQDKITEEISMPEIIPKQMKKSKKGAKYR